MSFSSVHFAERHGKGVPRGNVLARFLGSFFAAWQRMNIPAVRERVQLDEVEVGCASL